MKHKSFFESVTLPVIFIQTSRRCQIRTRDSVNGARWGLEGSEKVLIIPSFLDHLEAAVSFLGVVESQESEEGWIAIPEGSSIFDLSDQNVARSVPSEACVNGLEELPGQTTEWSKGTRNWPQIVHGRHTRHKAIIIAIVSLSAASGLFSSWGEMNQGTMIITRKWKCLTNPCIEGGSPVCKREELLRERDVTDDDTSVL
ncbi:hypothetical protein J6590_061548 [Homalodisca vitripennis]|nr:hypothetical protein J6590_061548 [Homalodisca vitripennis]